MRFCVIYGIVRFIGSIKGDFQYFKTKNNAKTGHKHITIFYYGFYDELKLIYEKEGIDLSHIEFTNNDKTCSLLEDPRDGIIRLIEDEVTMPKGNDESLAIRIHTKHASHPNYNKIKKHKMQFEIIHFAGKVKYEIGGFFDKNLDALTQCTKDILSNSNLNTMKVLYNNVSSKKRKTKCIGTVFLKSLQHLIKSINNTKPQFIRCIKPNHEKKAGIWEYDMISKQLRFGGIFAYLELRRCGYDVQISFDTFVNQMIYALRDKNQRNSIYKLIANKAKDTNEWIKCAKLLKSYLLKLYDLKHEDIQFGKTKVFMQNTNYRKIEFAATFWIISFQKRWRNIHQQNKENKKKESAERQKQIEMKRKKEKENEIKRKKEEEMKRMEAEKLRKQKEIDMEVKEMENEINEEKHRLSSELKKEMKLLEKEFEEQEMKIMTNIKMLQKQKESEWNLKKEDLKSDMMMKLNQVTIDARFEANQNVLRENEKQRQKLMLQIGAFNAKQKSLKKEIINKIKKVKKVKVEIKKLKSRGNAQDAQFLCKPKKNVKNDMFEIGSIGEISEKGGSSFYVSLNDDRFGFKGSLYFGDKIVLISKKGYRNLIDDDVLSIKVMVIKSKLGKYQKEIGYIKLTSTTFFTRRTVNDWL